MAAPASSLSGASNHARLHRSICKNRCPQPIKTGKTEYLPRAETHTPPERWEFFTDDYIREETGVATAKVFKSGNSQAVRLPKQFRLASDEVEIFRRGEEIVLREKLPDLGPAFSVLSELADLIGDAREDSIPQEREGL